VSNALSFSKKHTRVRIPSSNKQYTGGFVNYTLVIQTASSLLGSTIVNTANISSPFDPLTSNNNVTISLPLVRSRDFSIVKQSSVVVAGALVTYSITVFNNGPSDAVVGRATVTDVFDNRLSSISWTCFNSTGSTCNGGSGSILNDTSVSAKANTNFTYVVTARLSTTATASLINMAVVNASGDPNTADNTFQVVDLPIITTDISISKLINPTTIVPGLQLTFNIFAINLGPSNLPANALTIEDYITPQLANIYWNCTASNGGTCGALPPPSGYMYDAPVLPFNARVNYTISALILPTARSLIINTASATISALLDTTQTNNAARRNRTLTPSADIRIDLVTATNPVAGLTTQHTIRGIGVSILDIANTDQLTSKQWLTLVPVMFFHRRFLL